MLSKIKGRKESPIFSLLYAHQLDSELIGAEEEIARCRHMRTSFNKDGQRSLDHQIEYQQST